MGQRIAVMSDGLLQQVGTPQQLYDHPLNRFVAGFIGSPSMNFIETAAPDGGPMSSRPRASTSRSRSYRAALKAGTRATTVVVVGFRPEHLELGEVAGPSAQHPGHRRRRRVPRQRGAAPRDRRRHATSSRSSTRPTGSARATSSRSRCRSTKLHLFHAEKGDEPEPRRRPRRVAARRWPRPPDRLTTPHHRRPARPSRRAGRSHVPEPHDRADVTQPRPRPVRRRPARGAGRRAPGSSTAGATSSSGSTRSSAPTAPAAPATSSATRARSRSSRSTTTAGCCSSASGGSPPGGRCSRSRPARSTSTTASPRTPTSPPAASSRRRPGHARRDVAQARRRSGPRPGSPRS